MDKVFIAANFAIGIGTLYYARRCFRSAKNVNGDNFTIDVAQAFAGGFISLGLFCLGMYNVAKGSWQLYWFLQK
jgi:hypothetical protein